MEGGKEQNYWPGFVDALSNVVLTLVFVLVVFVFALMMASNKVEKKMQEVASAQKIQQEDQAQLNQALAELQQLRQQESSNSNNTAQQQACVKFNKSDSSQKTEIGADATSVKISFTSNAISVTDETAKSIDDFIKAYQTRTGDTHTKFVIEAPDDPSSASPLLARETQLGRMLNVRNSLLNGKVEARNIVVHNAAPGDDKTDYNWVKIHAEK